MNVSMPAAEEDAIFGSYGFELRDATPALRVGVGASFGDRVRERDAEADE